MFNNRFFLTNNLKRWMTWVEMNQPKTNTGNPCCDHAVPFYTQCREPQLIAWEHVKTLSRFPNPTSCIPYSATMAKLFATVLHCNSFIRNTRDFLGFFSSQILFLVIWNSYIAHNQLQKKGLTLRISKTK